MACNCPNINCTQRVELGVTYCDCPIVITNITCPPGCTVIIQPNGNAVCSCTETVAPTLVDSKIKVELTNPAYFKDISWTIAYSPILQSWMSFYDFKPNYYISHNDYFQTGINSSNDSSEIGLWSHLLTNKSYQVFYGKKYPWLIEYTLKRPTNDILLNSITYQADAFRYMNEYDYSEADSMVFNKVWIHSSNTHSGELRLVKNTGVLSQISNYPKTAPNDSYQEVLVSRVGNNYSLNYFYNRIHRRFANNAPWIFDDNQIEKTVNQEVVKFKSKDILQPLKTKVPTIRLSQDQETRFRYVFYLGISKFTEQTQ